MCVCVCVCVCVRVCACACACVCIYSVKLFDSQRAVVVSQKLVAGRSTEKPLTIPHERMKCVPHL